MVTLQDHYERHGADFASKSADDYAAQAWHFLQRAKREALPMKEDETDGTIRVWDPKTRSFAAYTERGRTRTYFRPNNSSYWDRQPGRPIKPADLPF
jgi:pyocin large subunit-like protein